MTALVSALDRTGTGLEYLQKVASGEHGALPIGEAMGFRLAEASKGRVVFEGSPGEAMLNLIGTVHGGFAASILDSALALSVLSALDADSNFTTLEIKVNFVRPITVGMEVRAEGIVVHAGRRVATSEARLMDKEGRLLAHGTTTCLVLPRA